MTASAANDTTTIEAVAAEIARRFDSVRLRTEDRLNDECLQRVIREKVTEVLQQMAMPLRPVTRTEDLLKVKPDHVGHDFTVERIAEMLKGRPAPLQGAILGELAARWLVGHPPELRDKSLDTWVWLIRRLIQEQEKMLFGPGGYPFG